MASRREYEMLFQLSAQMNGNFAGTFSKAQQQLLGFQKEIQELNKTQGDISAYQKQQQAVENTKKKLETLQQQYDNIQREISETGEFSSDLENKLLSKQQQIDKTTAALGQQTQKLDQMGAALREAGVDTANLEKESERLEAELGDVKKKQEEAAEGAESFGKKTADAFSAAGAAIAAAGIAVALKEIYEGYVQCINVAGDFEASMSNVEALSGASAEELAQLSALAKELGATTKFTAKESADAMGYMAMAGWSAEQMLQGMPGVLQLAAAAGEDLATVSDIVTDSMTAFGLTAADTARYADVLAATAANANTSVSVMGETFKYAAPVAGALGYSIEDVSTAIGLMANAGIKGSNAGTALRNVFNGLLEGVTLTGEAFGEAEVSAVRADGTMADFATTIDQLRGYFNQMTEAERVNNAMAIAGQRGYAGLLSILNASEADYAKLTEAINNSTGAAQHMADVKMDNMVGQLTLLNSAWEAVQTTVGEQFTPILSDLYSMFAGILSEVNGFLQRNPALIKAITAFIAVIGLVVGGIVAYTAAAKLAAIASAALSASIPGLNIIMAVTAGIAALTAVFVGLASAMKEDTDESLGLIATSKEQYYQLQELRAEYEEVCDTYGETSEEARYLAWRIEDLSESFNSNKQTVDDYIEGCKQLNDSLNDTLDSNRNTFNEIGANEETTLALVHRLQELASQTEQTVETQEEMKAIIAELNKVVPDLALNYDDVVSGVVDYGAALESAVKAQAASQRYEAAQQGMVDAMNAQVQATRELEDETYGLYHMRELEAKNVEDLQARYDQLQESYSFWVNSGGRGNNPYEKDRDAAKAALADAKDALEKYDEQIREHQETIETAVTDYERYKDELVDYMETIGASSDSTAEVKETITSVTERVQELTKAYQEAYDAAYSSVTGQYALWDEADEVIAKSIDDINTALSSQVEHWNAYNDNLAALRARTGDIEGLSDVIASFADGSNESVAAIAGMAAASDEDLKLMVEQWQELQKSQEETSDKIAEFKTNFTEQMNELTLELRDDIQELDVSDEAAEAGKATIQAFIDAAEEMEPRVRSAYAKLGAYASAALSGASGNYNNPVNTHGWYSNAYAGGTEYAEAGLALVGEYGPELMMLQGGEKILTAAETRELQAEYIEVMAFLPTLFKQIRGYAGGTDNAAPGLAWLGENGPEAIAGAQFATPRTDAVEAISDALTHRGDGSYIVTFSPVYNISGDMNPEELEAVLREHDENLKEQLEELLEEIEEDKARCAYR